MTCCGRPGSSLGQQSRCYRRRATTCTPASRSSAIPGRSSTRTRGAVAAAVPSSTSTSPSSTRSGQRARFTSLCGARLPRTPHPVTEALRRWVRTVESGGRADLAAGRRFASRREQPTQSLPRGVPSGPRAGGKGLVTKRAASSTMPVAGESFRPHWPRHTAQIGRVRVCLLSTGVHPTRATGVRH